jgi:hypothetical protein
MPGYVINGAIPFTEPHFSETAMDINDKRQKARQAITHIVYMATGLGPPLKCEMKDVSELGARIVVSDARSSPQEFLVLLKDDLVQWCQVMWRSEREMGIKFVRPPKSLRAKKAKEKAKTKAKEKTQ